LDGFVVGPDRDPEWPIVDEEIHGPFLEELAEADAFLYGRRTYGILSAFWPWADAEPGISEFHVAHARMWKTKRKYVYAPGPTTGDWGTTVVHEDPAAHVRALRAKPGATLALFAGTELLVTLLANDLIDEYRLFVRPFLFGGGVPLFVPGADPVHLDLLETRAFDSAAVHLHYRRPLRAAALAG
jgi:dihydrofolate reductase